MAHLRRAGWVARINKEGHTGDLWDDLLEQLQLLPDQLWRHRGKAGDVSSRACEAGDESRRHRITSRHHDDGDSPDGLLCTLDRRANHNDEIYVETDQLGREAGNPVIVPLRPSDSMAMFRPST